MKLVFRLNHAAQSKLKNLIHCFLPEALNMCMLAGLLAPPFCRLLAQLAQWLLLQTSLVGKAGVTVAGTALVFHEIPF